MKTSRCFGWMRLFCVSLTITFLSMTHAPATFARSQEPTKQPSEVDQLKQRLQQLEQTVQELKGQISAMEDAKATSSNQPKVVQATYSETPVTANAAVPNAKPQNDNEKKGESTFEVYGFAMLDAGYQF